MSYKSTKSGAIANRKEKNYQKAIEQYETLLDKYSDQCDKWDIWGYAYCLKQQNDYHKAIEICRDGLDLFPDFQNLKNLLAWSLYYCYNFDAMDTEEVMSAVDEIVLLKGDDERYSPTTKVIFKAVKYFRQHHKSDLVISYLSIVDKDHLNDNSFTYNNKGRNISLPSEKETYYNYLTDALYRTQKYEECLSYCEEAISTINTFNNGNDIWIMRRKALCHTKQDRCKEAISILKSIYAKKKNWFVLKDIAEAYYLCSDLENALHYTVKAIDCQGNFDMKVNLFEMAGDIMNKKGMKKEAKEHYLLALSLRKINGWKISSELIDKAETLEVIVDRNELVNRLRPIWRMISKESSKVYHGTISNILANNKAGFIKSLNGKSYYFNLIKNGINSFEVEVGERVEFCLEDSFDKKKNIATKEAVKVSLCKPEQRN